MRRQVRLSSGEVASYENLIWAAGGEPRRLTCPGSDLEGVHYVRHKADVEAILQDLSGGPKRVVVVGGGYIGLEAAAVLTKLGHRVMLLEAQSRLLARVAGPDLSTFFEATHRDQGVDVRTDCELTALRGAMGRVAGVELAGGEVLGADLVIVGIGIVPSIEALSQAGCDCSNGVAVDRQCQTSVPNIYAIGDCALHTNRFAGGATLRLESVQNAHDMAAVVARNLCGQSAVYEATPWFWSNQYDLKLQTVGLSFVADRATLRGQPESRSFSVVYLAEGQVVALDCVNAMKDFVQGRKLVEAGAIFPPQLLADSSIQLKDLRV